MCYACKHAHSLPQDLQGRFQLDKCRVELCKYTVSVEIPVELSIYRCLGPLVGDLFINYKLVLLYFVINFNAIILIF